MQIKSISPDFMDVTLSLEDCKLLALLCGSWEGRTIDDENQRNHVESELSHAMALGAAFQAGAIASLTLSTYYIYDIHPDDLRRMKTLGALHPVLMARFDGELKGLDDKESWQKFAEDLVANNLPLAAVIAHQWATERGVYLICKDELEPYIKSRIKDEK